MCKFPPTDGTLVVLGPRMGQLMPPKVIRSVKFLIAIAALELFLLGMCSQMTSEITTDGEFFSTNYTEKSFSAVFGVLVKGLLVRKS